METRQYVPATVGDTRTILLGRNRLSSLATPPALAAKLAERSAIEGSGRDFRAVTAPVRTVQGAALTAPASSSHYVRKTLPAPANSARPGNQHPRLK